MLSHGPYEGRAIHHPNFMIKLKEKADNEGVDTRVILRYARRQNYFARLNYLKYKLLEE